MPSPAFPVTFPRQSAAALNIKKQKERGTNKEEDKKTAPKGRAGRSGQSISLGRRPVSLGAV
jgi:hypothetical protein